ncbi:HAD-IA family hydrolase [Salinisphaera sp. P385]|uniref:HAD-IA family hydrolase n=1 Tax=Spectribacter acetivorans TaxID=3075603 RepID=A0ABU3B364_9GAMM|nr:HAD-IA family hydrolase [Salinisphaera sp. P385]MDT0616898.1 HAD-IA family hydrolase [Salinisphaera sp. P385]
MTPPELIIFDWDGTVMDSAAEIVMSMQRAIQDIGLPERDADRMRELIGLGLNDVLARLFPEMEVDRVKALLTAYRRRYTAPGGESRPFAGAEAAIADLHGRGHWLAVATGKSRRGLDRNFRETGLGQYFRFSRCADETTPKPAPDMLEDILLQSATMPDAALMVGDTEYDMRMARDAGVAAVGVACGVHDTDRLMTAGALAVIPDVAALPAWLTARADGQAMAVGSAPGE